jgi:hypothetical protein
MQKRIRPLLNRRAYELHWRDRAAELFFADSLYAVLRQFTGSHAGRG